jgi:hypothetical protein
MLKPAIDFLPVANLRDDDQHILVADLVDNPIPAARAGTNPKEFLSRFEFLDSQRTRVLGEPLDVGQNLLLNLSFKLLDLAHSGRPKLDGVRQWWKILEVQIFLEISE